MKNLKNYLFIWAVTLLVNQSFASSNQSTSHKATASLAGSCSINVSNMSFGTYTPGKGDVFFTSPIKTRCSNKLSYTLGINWYAHNTMQSTDTYTAHSVQSYYWIRYMTNNGNNLVYNLFQDAAHTKVFGGPNNWYDVAGAIPSFIGTGAEQITYVYGAMSGNQFVAPGNYSDTQQVVVTF